MTSPARENLPQAFFASKDIMGFSPAPFLKEIPFFPSGGEP